MTDNIVPNLAFSWESQAVQYAPKGEPGIHLEQHTVGKTIIDCLLCRDQDGLLIGILNHYNEGSPLEKAGACNLWIKPECRRQGIAAVLLRDAWHRWSLDYEQQTWTPEGHAWLDGLVNKGKIDSEYTESLNEELDWTEPPAELDCWWLTL